MDADELRADVTASMLRVIADVVLHNHAVAQRLGLGTSDLQFLGLLGRDGRLSPGRLAELTGLSTGTVTGVLDRLETGGFVRRERDAGDRRKVVVVPEPAGAARLTEHYAAHGAHLDAVLRRRDPAELRVIADFLRELLGSGSS